MALRRSKPFFSAVPRVPATAPPTPTAAPFIALPTPDMSLEPIPEPVLVMEDSTPANALLTPGAILEVSGMMEM